MRIIHTTVSDEIYKKLIQYGEFKKVRSRRNGLNTSIEAVIKVAESKEITVKIITEVKV